MTAEFPRDAAATAAVLGFFASAWFGWAQEQPPSSWRRWLVLGSICSLLIAMAGGIRTWTLWSDGTAIDSETGPVFGVIVAIEVAAAGVGAGLLARFRRRDLIPPWIAIVVGVHLFPLAWLLQYPMLAVVAVLVALAALAAVPFAKRRRVAVSAVTGLAVGVVLFVAAAFSLITVVDLGVRLAT